MISTNCEFTYWAVTFTLDLRRQVLYYAMYLIIPGTLIALLAAIIFLLPQDCSERITVGEKNNNDCVVDRILNNYNIVNYLIINASATQSRTQLERRTRGHGRSLALET